MELCCRGSSNVLTTNSLINVFTYFILRCWCLIRNERVQISFKYSSRSLWLRFLLSTNKCFAPSLIPEFFSYQLIEDEWRHPAKHEHSVFPVKLLQVTCQVWNSSKIIDIEFPIKRLMEEDSLKVHNCVRLHPSELFTDKFKLCHFVEDKFLFDFFGNLWQQISYQ